MLTISLKNFQVIRKHFKDLSYVSVNSETSGSQQLVVYTDSKDELNLLLVISLDIVLFTFKL